MLLLPTNKIYQFPVVEKGPKRTLNEDTASSLIKSNTADNRNVTLPKSPKILKKHSTPYLRSVGILERLKQLQTSI